jgi:hypothetical protein
MTGDTRNNTVVDLTGREPVVIHRHPAVAETQLPALAQYTFR